MRWLRTLLRDVRGALHVDDLIGAVELHVGSRNVFAEARPAEVAHPTKRRYVMRIDF